MGNHSSNTRNEEPSNLSESERDEINTQIVTEVTSKDLFGEEWRISTEDKELLQSSWETLRSNLQSIGVVTLLKLFETHPETLKTFIQEVHSLQEIELNEWYREKLRVHALRVMAVVEKTIHRLNEETKAAMILVNYGHRHKGYGVTLHMLELMGKCFVVSIQGELEDADCWNSRMEKAWLNMFRFITFFMSVGYGDGFLKCQKGKNGELFLELPSLKKQMIDEDSESKN